MNRDALPESRKALDKAIDALATARHDLSAHFCLAAVNRSYYSMFYCMTALLYLNDVYTKKSSGH